MLRITSILLSALTLGAFTQTYAADEPALTQHQPVATFDWFEYIGKDQQFAAELPNQTYQNPILPGFYPDPSITRKGDDYYLVNSSFAYTPGLPVLHSKNLVDWQLVGHALTSENAIDFTGLELSRGIFAPTIRYHDGLFYIITTAVDAGGNFIITAKDPAGPWSSPIWLPEVGGIDPDLFFDANGKAYIAHNDAPPGPPQYDGHRAIWLWEYDVEQQKVKAGSRRLLINGGTDIAAQPVWIEGPHIYHINGWYYLTCAQGGTSVNHSQVVFRTRSLAEEFEPYQNNPILTQKDLPRQKQIVSATGHADFIQTPEGDWWSVFLATRPYQDDHYNTGRETFLLPIHWENEWPHILPSGETVPLTPRRPAIAPDINTKQPLARNFSWRDEFTGSHLNPLWVGVKQFSRDWLSLSNGALHMRPQSASLSNLGHVSYLGRRQQHQRFTARTQLAMPVANTVAGLAVYQNETHHYQLLLSADNAKAAKAYQVSLYKVSPTGKALVAQQAIATPASTVVLQVDVDEAQAHFSFQLNGQNTAIGPVQDARHLSTASAGGFVGATVGMVALQASDQR